MVLTDGARECDVAWLQHTGADVYCGPVASPGKITYHASGIRSSTLSGKRNVHDRHFPLSRLRGSTQLLAFGFDLPGGVFGRDYARRQADAVAYLDTRAMPTGRTINVIVGLVEPHNLGALPPRLPSVTVQQLLVVTSVKPWVYIVVAW